MIKAARITNVIIIALVSLIICVTGISLVAVNLGFQFPSWTNIGTTKSQLEGRKYTPAPDLSPAAIASGEFQSEFESYLSDHIPMRDSVLLSNAALQRSSIALAAATFGFECYPTYFDSDYMYLTAKDAVNFIPETWDDEAESLTREFARGVAKTASRYPDKRFIVYVVPGAQSPAVSPAYELMSSPMKPDISYNVISEELAATSNAWVLTSQYEDLDDFYDDFFRGDHHWNILGALKAYDNIGAVLGWSPFEYSSLKGFGDYRFFGSTARSGLDTILEPVFDIDYDFSSIEITTTNGKTKNADNHETFYDFEPKSGKKFAFHTYYYNTQPPRGVFAGGEGDRTGLLVSNSYGAVISRPLSLRYEKLYRTNDLHSDAHDQHISADLEKEDFDDVIFVAQPFAYKTTAQQSPDYFD